MVDFKKRLAKGKTERVIDPVALYDTLDRASDKGPIRPAQEAILKEWFAHHRDKKDVILKLATGQGKTLIGLLILQSRINEGHGPAMYLCANQFLVNQTCEQARQFGIAYCEAGDELPAEFLEGKIILVTLVHKLFSGLTKFGLGKHSEEAKSIVIDDAHACIDAIRKAFIIRIQSSEEPYTLIRDLFATDLKNQGMGTFADIANGEYGTFLPIPYWAWIDRHEEVATFLARAAKSDSVKFAWPLIRDMLDKCQCVVSGRSLEIAPYLPPLEKFGTYTNAPHRVYMSATVADDSFLIRGLGLSPDTVTRPLTYEKERWSGEKMILIPSLIDDSLDRGSMVKAFASPREGRKYGIVALVPSFKGSGDWEKYGSTIANTKTIDAEVAKLRRGDRDKPLVVANRYDGIDLPDDSCRILIFDSRPYSEDLTDLYAESCRSASAITAIRTARAIEQGLGRSVRGERDYCVIVIIGPDLVKCVRSRASQKYLSSQTRQQIQIGLDVAAMAREDMEKGVAPLDVLRGLVGQCLRRDSGWKAFYAEKMDVLGPESVRSGALELFTEERRAEIAFTNGKPAEAASIIQKLIDNHIREDEEKGWYLQEMARYLYSHDKSESNRIQIAAHQKNHALMKPQSGMTMAKIAISQHRIEAIMGWLRKYGVFEELRLATEEILARLSFGVKSDAFENAFNQLGRLLGFAGQRPEREWKEGPDNLWGLREGEYLLVECKNEVALDRADINPREVEQMNRSCAWFSRNYPGANATNVMIIPSRKVSRGTTFTHTVEVMRPGKLGALVKNARAFILEFSRVDLKDLSEKRVQEWLNVHKLSVDDIVANYTEAAR